jgi:predicted permease
MWLRALFRRAEVERDLDDELRFHIASETEKLIRQGVSPDEAERRARRAFGGVERIKDDTRDARGTAWIDAILYDVRHALRGVRRRPGFAAAVILTLGLGLGANIAMFGIVDRLLFRPPAYLHDPARIHRVYIRERLGGTEYTEKGMPYTQYRDLARWSSAFDGTAAFGTDLLAVGTGEATRRMQVGIVSASYFDLFDARPVIGRFFTAREDSVGAAAPVVVLTSAFWRAQYGGQPNALGQVLEVGSLPCTIIGVAPPGFAGVDDDLSTSVFIPANTYGASMHYVQNSTDYYTKYNWSWTGMLARRRAGITAAAATADLSRAFRLSYEAERTMVPSLPTADVAKPSALAAPIQLERGPLAGADSRVALWTSGVALMVLLIACANVANLFLVRGLQRQREHALRLALGVSRGRLLRHIVTELGLLAGVATAAGVAIALIGGRVLRALFLPNAGDVSALGDQRTLIFAGLAAVLTAALTALAPAFESGRAPVAAMIKDGARDATRRGSRLRAALLSVQAALSVVLLVGAGLFVRSLSNVRAIRLGYDVDPILYVGTNWRGGKLTRPQEIALTHRLADEARTIPGVTRVAFGMNPPLVAWVANDLFTNDHDSVPQSGRFAMKTASPEYFRTMGTRILRGRSFTDADREGAPGVALVSAPMAEQLWPGRDAIGQCLRIGADTTPCTVVVGITESVKEVSLVADSGGQYYLPTAQYAPEDATLFVRVDGDASRLVETVRQRLQRLMPGASFVTVNPLRDVVDPQVRSWQLGATMFVAFGALALLLAAIGLYSVIAFGVAQRTRELGVRVALGARIRDVLYLILSDGMRFTVIGLGLGAAIAVGVGHWIQPLLYDEQPADPWVLGAVTGVLALAAVAASILPALRASRVDPNIALRAD